MRHAFTLLLLALVAFWPRFQFEGWTGTEARRVQIAAEMHASGDWMVPTLGGEPGLAEPPLHYWVLASLLALGDDPQLLRLPSAIAIWLLALVAFGALQRDYSTLSAWVGAVGILLSPMVLVHVPSAEIDPLFTALTGISIIWLAEGAAFLRPSQLMLGGIVGGLALLTKGPPYFMFLTGTTLVWLRRLRLRGAAWFGVPLLLIPLAYYGPRLFWHTEPMAIVEAAIAESVGRLTSFSWPSVFNIPLFVLGAVAMLMPLGWWTFHEYRGDREMREAVLGREEAFVRMCGWSMVGAILLLIVFPSRPGRYLLPGVPLYLVALAPAVAHYARHGTGPSRVLGRLIGVGAVVGSLGVMLIPWLPFPFRRFTSLFLLAFAVTPMWIHTRRQVAVWVLLLPLIGAWTVLGDRSVWLSRGPRDLEMAGRVVAAELARLGVDDVATRGDFPSAIVLCLERIPPADRHRTAPPQSRGILLQEYHGAPVEELPGYSDRLRLRLSDRTIVLKVRE